MIEISFDWIVTMNDDTFWIRARQHWFHLVNIFNSHINVMYFDFLHLSIFNKKLISVVFAINILWPSHSNNILSLSMNVFVNAITRLYMWNLITTVCTIEMYWCSWLLLLFFLYAIQITCLCHSVQLTSSDRRNNKANEILLDLSTFCMCTAFFLRCVFSIAFTLFRAEIFVVFFCFFFLSALPQV